MKIKHTHKHYLAMILTSLLLAACSNKTEAPTGPAQVDQNTACSLDGMILMDYPGPKGQIIYEQGEPDFFCDTTELFSIYLKPEQQRKIKGIYVQDMSKADWVKPEGHWIDAKTAFFVLGAKLNGSMGPTFASFSLEKDAAAFAAKEGGKVYRFDQITPDLADLDGGVIKDKMMM